MSEGPFLLGTENYEKKSPLSARRNIHLILHESHHTPRGTIHRRSQRSSITQSSHPSWSSQQTCAPKKKDTHKTTPTTTTLVTWTSKHTSPGRVALQPTQAQPLTCLTRQKTTRTRTPSVGLRSNGHSQARRPPRLVRERSYMRSHAKSLPAPQDFPRRHAPLVLSLLPRPPTNRRSPQPPDLGQPTLDRRKTRREAQTRRRASCAQFLDTAPCGRRMGTSTLQSSCEDLFLRAFALLPSATHGTHRGSCTCHKSNQLGAEHHYGTSHNRPAVPKRTGTSALCNRHCAAPHPHVASALPAHAKILWFSAITSVIAVANMSWSSPRLSPRTRRLAFFFGRTPEGDAGRELWKNSSIH